MNNPFESRYYSTSELLDAGFKSIGENVWIARDCNIVGVENISIGDNTRIDNYCIIVAAGEGWLNIGSHVHIGGWVFLSGSSGIKIGDFSGLSHGVKVYSRTDDFAGSAMSGPTVPDKYKNVKCGTVWIGRHCIVGSNSVVLPGVSIEEGATVGAQSLVNRSLASWGVFAGIPVKRIKSRSKAALSLEKKMYP